MRSLVTSVANTGVSVVAISSELVKATARSFVPMTFPLLGHGHAAKCMHRSDITLISDCRQLRASYLRGMLQPKHPEHRRVGLVAQLRIAPYAGERVAHGAVGTHAAHARSDRHVLLAVHRVGHRRGVEAGADVESPH